MGWTLPAFGVAFRFRRPTSDRGFSTTAKSNVDATSVAMTLRTSKSPKEMEDNDCGAKTPRRPYAIAFKTMPWQRKYV